jgi:type VI secretion system protein ImpF
MSRIDSQQGIMPSLLDRLIDPESGGTAWRRGYSAEQMTEAVLRDLEDLLNTHKAFYDVPEDFVEVRRSIVAYGLPDLASFNAVTQEQRNEIGQALESIIAQFEPRLKDIRATVLDPGDSKDRSVRFRVDARLCLDPAPEVAFDTVLELSTGHYSVKAAQS